MVDKPLVQDFATDWDHTDPQWVKDPYPIWDDLRGRCPVAHTERFGGGWFVSTWEGVSQVAKDTVNFTSRTPVVANGRPDELAPPAPIGIAPPISSDPPFHAIARRLILPPLSPGKVAALEPEIREICVRLLDKMEGLDVVNGGHEYAEHITPTVIQRLLGFPESDEEIFKQFVNDVLGGVDAPLEERIETFERVRAYIQEQIEDHKANPRDDLTTYLVNAELEGQPLSDDHIFGTAALTLIAGIDTTWSAIASSLWHLGSNPEDLARLVAEPDLLPVAVEEFLRFYAPVSMGRLVKQDMDYMGCPMKEYDWMFVGFPAANRDPAAFKDADKFIIDRKENRHVAFGLGIHRCAGSNLARLELTIAIEEFVKRYPRFTLDDPEAVTWSQGQVRGARNVPLRILS